MDNQFKVPKKQWASWSLLQRHVFNRTYGALYVCGACMYPQEIKTTKAQRKVIAWNAAWLAADAA